MYRNLKNNKKILVFLLVIGFSIIPALMTVLQTNAPLNMTEKDDNDQESELIKKPKLSGTQINITTPENKTYTEPMSGYYPATYSFDCDQENVVNASEWIGDSQGVIWTKIQNEKDGHKKVYRLYDQVNYDYAGIRNTFSEAQTSGTIEWWWYVDETDHAGYIYLFDSNIGTVLRAHPSNCLNDDWQVVNSSGTYIYNASVWTTNTWHLMRLDFEMTNGGYQGLSEGKFRLSSDGVSFEAYLESGLLNVSKFQLRTKWGGAVVHNYWVDAVGYSWDPNYNIGDNNDEGLLLSYDIGFEANWTGYSLDGQDNITILGNTTIEMPFNGLHSIQVFANDSSGTNYQSEVRYFSIGQDGFFWYDTWGGASNERGHGIAIDSKGNWFVCGYTESFGAGGQDLLLSKYDKFGNKLWNITWGGVDNDGGSDVAIDSDDNVIVTGTTQIYDPKGDMLLIKFDNDGNEIWNTTWGDVDNDSGTTIAINSTNAIFVGGGTFSGADPNIFLAAFDSDKNLLWDESIGTIYGEWSGGKIDLDSSSNVYITMITWGHILSTTVTWTQKYDMMGNMQWEKYWGASGGRDSPNGLTVDKDDNVYITGNTERFSPGRDVFLIKYNSSGVLKWVSTWGGDDDEEGNKLYSDEDGNVYISGYTKSYGAGLADLLVIKYNSSGDLIWNNTFGDSLDDFGNEITMDEYGNLIITGKTDNFGAVNTSLLLVSYYEPDIIPPQIDGTNEDQYYSQYSVGNYLQWNITEVNKGTYVIKRNETIVSSGPFYNWVNISIEVNTTILGDWNYTIIATDPSNNVATHSVLIHVVDITNPSITDLNYDLTVEQGNPSSFTWKVIEDNPANYSIFRNGTLVKTGTYDNDTIVIFGPFLNLTLGDLLFEIVVNDTSGNQDTVQFIIEIIDITDPSITSLNYDLTVEQGNETSFYWKAIEDNPANYSIFRNGTLIETGIYDNDTTETFGPFLNWTIGELLFEIVVNDTSGNSDTAQFIIKIIERTDEHIFCEPSGACQIDLTGESLNLYININVSSAGFLDIDKHNSNFVADNIWGDLKARYFYSFTMLNASFKEDESILNDVIIRFYYDPNDIDDESKLYLLHYVWSAGPIGIWEAEEITINTDENYIEVSLTELSVFCLAEIDSPLINDDDDDDDDDDGGLDFIIFITNNMIIIIILSAIGVTMTTSYLVISKKKKINEKEKSAKQYTEIDMTGIAESAEDMILKAEAKREALTRRTWTPAETEKPKKSELKTIPGAEKQVAVIAPKKKKKVEEVPKQLNAEEQDEIKEETKKTESEMTIKEKIDKCTIHKGRIKGMNYVCHNCHAKYCLNCAEALVQKDEGCWVCDSKIILNPDVKASLFKETPLEERRMDDLDNLSENERVEKFILEASNILKIWIFDQNNNDIYDETLDTTYISEELFDNILPELLKGNYEKDVFNEKSFIIGTNRIYCVIYYSKFLVNTIIISKNRMEKSFYPNVKKSIETIEEQFVEIKKTPMKVKEIFDRNMFLHLSREYLELPTEMDNILKKIFKDKDELKEIKSELKRFPDDLFPEFLELYGKLNAELEQVDKEYDDENDDEIGFKIE